MNQRRKLVLITLSSLILATSIAQFLLPKATPLHASAITTTNSIGVYWDAACSRRVNYVDWGILTPGKNREIFVYVRNEGNGPCVLILKTTSWNPNSASSYLKFSWTCESNKIKAGGTVKIKQTLQVSAKIAGITNFSFGIAFEATDKPPWDTNQDGKVDILDMIIVTNALGSTPQSLRWDPRADVNSNGIVNVLDSIAVADHLED